MPVNRWAMSLEKRVRYGVTYGLSFAAFYIAWVTILYAATKGEAFQSKNLSYLSVVSIYLFGGIAAGGVVGALLPLITNVVTASIIGFVAALPVTAGFEFLDAGMTGTGVDVVTILIGSAALGGIGGGGLFVIFSSQEGPSDNN